MIKRIFFFLILSLSSVSSFAQNPELDYTWWNELHDWHEGDPGWRNWIKITPGFLGPNALPVPEVKRGFLTHKTEIEVTASNHFHPGDPTRDISARLFVPFAQGRIAVEMWGVVLERFAFSEEIRNERFARIENGKGLSMGDFYFSTLIQLSKGRKFPNTLLRLATKTASGGQFQGARYTDSPGYFFDLSFSKDFGNAETGIFRPFGLAGFYSWQTNDELNLQNDALMYAIGADFVKKGWTLSGSCAGYSGYKQERDKPLQLNVELRKDWSRKALRVQYLHGVHKWQYKTVKCSFIWKMNGVQ